MHPGGGSEIRPTRRPDVPRPVRDRVPARRRGGGHAKIEAKWDAALDQARPDLRDVVAAAAALAPTYMASSGPLCRMYIEAIRGSFAPEIYEFSRGPEIMTALLKAGIRPDDIEVLDKLSQTTADFLMLTKALTGDLEDVKLEACERLAAGGFIDIVNKAMAENGHKIFITHRTEATSWNVTVRITERGRKLLVMMKAGRGQ